ncbi:MAG: type II secretion system F family protein [Desulfobulbaceae bacterium]|nr:type II secretion system F family protein [Desulfobulbaceae bacterium]
MPIFKYEAVNSAGKLVGGTREAALINDVESWLLGNGMSPVDISITTVKQGGFGAETVDRKITFSERFRGVSLEERILFCRQISTMLASGVAIMQALEIICRQTPNPLLEKIIAQVAEDIERGGNLSDSFGQYPKEFNTLFQNIIRVGEESGGLDTSFEYLAQVFENEREINEKIKTATRYPKIVVGSIFCAVLFLMTFVVPKFMAMFASARIELPLPTRILIWLSNGFSDHVLPNLVVGALVFFCYRTALKSRDFVRFRDTLFLKTPILGSLSVKIYMARFCRIFSVLTRSGVDIIRTLELAASGLDNLVLSETIELVKMDVGAGVDLQESMAKHKVFPPMVIQMVSIGEKSGTLEMMMGRVADYYDVETNYTIKNLSTLIEPALLAVIGAIVGLLALAIYLPMWNMMNVMR